MDSNKNDITMMIINESANDGNMFWNEGMMIILLTLEIINK